MTNQPFRVIGLDHIVLRCGDVETTLAWYLDRLGLAPVRVDEWRQGNAPFPSARVDATTIIDFVPGRPSEALDHLCLVVEPTDLEALARRGSFGAIDGPARRYGAQGNGLSVYVRDPDGTVVELRCYPDAGAAR